MVLIIISGINLSILTINIKTLLLATHIKRWNKAGYYKSFLQFLAYMAVLP